MNNFLDNVWSQVLTLAASLIGAYLTMVRNLNVRVTVIERRLDTSDKEMNKHDQKLDKILDTQAKMQADIASIIATLKSAQHYHEQD